MNEQELAALLLVAPPELREALLGAESQEWPNTLAEATLAAQEWVLEKPEGFIGAEAGEWEVSWGKLGTPSMKAGTGPDIFAAIRAALGA